MGRRKIEDPNHVRAAFVVTRCRPADVDALKLAARDARTIIEQKKGKGSPPSPSAPPSPPPLARP